ncbi:MAG: hypothetical protein LBT67_00675, partial [Holosporaceae bacterium]|nr:hypothetical protein [Holosporaceae bacterium]
MRKTLSFAAIALAVQLCHSMEFLSPEGQAAAKKLKHAEFIKTSDGKISEIKLKETNEIRQYRAEIKAEITGKLVEFFTKNSQQPNRVNYKEDIDKFFPIFDRRHSSSLHSYFVFNVLSEYCAAINHLFSLSIEKLNNEIKGILLPILDKYYKEITLYTEQYMPDKPQCIDFFLKCDEGNLGLFSTEISMELFAQLPAEFTFSRENIRIITADSIFAGFETLGLLPLNTITSYKKLMTKSQETDKNLLDRYTNLLQESRFIRLAKLTSEDFKIKCYTFKQNTDVEQNKKNVMQTIQASLDSLPK